MDSHLQQLSAAARRAVQSRQWATVRDCASEILRRDRKSAEGHFLIGLVEKASRHPMAAAAAFAKALELDAGRYDAAIELASQYAALSRHADAVELLRQYASQLGNSPLYLNVAGLTYTRLGLHEDAWPLYFKANELQPDIPAIQANLAACAVYVGRVEEAKGLYRALLAKAPAHQRNHYELSILERARDATHVEQMKQILDSNGLPPDKNIFLYYAIGKEQEDLERWEEAFHYYEMAGDAVTSMSPYDVRDDLQLIDKIIEVCDGPWLAAGPEDVPTRIVGKTPIFIVGLPRTGTTLTDRILASHSMVESVGETFFMEAVLRRIGGAGPAGDMTPAMIAAAAGMDIDLVASGYLDAVQYRFGDKPFFIDKLPENFLYLGFIAKAFPDARIVYLRRHPMDACFAMYKQSFFRFAYNLEDLGRYYVAHQRLLEHWRRLLGDRLIEVRYESLVNDPGSETRRLLAKLGLEFEQACLDFDRNSGVVATASSVQVREKIHTRSVGRWKHFEKPLQPLREHLEAAGIQVD